MKHKTGERFKKLAEELYEGNISDLARHMGMSPQSFNKYAQGKTMPGGKVLKRLIAIDVNLNWLLAGIPPMRISDIKEAQVAKVEMVNSGGEDYFSEINTENLNQHEADLLAEVKHFSNFLENRPLNPHVKTMLLELLIQSIDQAKEQPPHDPVDS